MSTAVAVGALAAAGAFVAKHQALQGLVVAVGRGAVELPGEMAGNALSQKVRAYLTWRPAADPDSLRDQLAQFGLQKAEDELQQFGLTGDKQWLFSALQTLMAASDQIQHADVQNDDKMWLHSIRVHHLLVVVAYHQASDMGAHPWVGLRAVERYLNRMFAMFHLKYMAAQKALFNSHAKMKQVKEHYSENMELWAYQLHVAVQAHGGKLAVTAETCSESKMILNVAFVFTPGLADLVRCPQCPVGFSFGGTCSNPGCRGYAPAIGELADTAQNECNGPLAVQIKGKGDFLSTYAKLSRGVLTLFESRGGAMLSAADVSDTQAIIVRAPKTPRVGRPHCLRIDLPVPDSKGVTKYIVDPASAVNGTRWRSALLALPSIWPGPSGVAIGFAPAPVPQLQYLPRVPEPAPVAGAIGSWGGDSAKFAVRRVGAVAPPAAFVPGVGAAPAPIAVAMADSGASAAAVEYELQQQQAAIAAVTARIAAEQEQSARMERARQREVDAARAEKLRKKSNSRTRHCCYCRVRGQTRVWCRKVCMTKRQNCVRWSKRQNWMWRRSWKGS